MRIAFVVDNPLRDLPGVVLTAAHLCWRGFTCYLVPMNLQHWELWPLMPDFVVLNYLRPANQELARNLMDLDIGVGVMETEGWVMSYLKGDTEKLLASDTAVRHGLSVYCSWSPVEAEYAVKNNWYLPGQVRVTGSPRFSFFVAPWNEAALRSSASLDRFPGPMVLINTAYTIANPLFQTREQEISMFVDQFGFDEAVARHWQRVEDEALAKMAELINHLAKLFPNVTFICRPHPFERPETYHDLVKPRGNVHIVKEGTVDGWILRSAAVIQRGCATAIDAGLAGVPSLTPMWIPTDVESKELESVTISCESIDEMADMVRRAVEGQLTVPDSVAAALDKTVADWFYLNDGKAHERVADAIFQVLPRQSPRVSVARCRALGYGLYKKEPRWTKLLKMYILRILEIGPHSYLDKRRTPLGNPAKWDAGDKAFTLQDVQRVVESILPVASRLYGDHATPIDVAYSRDRGDYRFARTTNRSIVLSPR